MNKLKISTEMRKRGLILLVLVVFAIFTVFLINAAPTDTGCCTNPDVSDICTQMTEIDCCGGAADYDGCVVDYFYVNKSCSYVPGLLCKPDTYGTCTNTGEPLNFCKYVDYKARCYYREDFVAELLPEEIDKCKEGCCICTDETESRYVWDSLGVYGGAILTGDVCTDFCTSTDYKIAIFDTSITDVDACLSIFQGYTKANLSGYVRAAGLPVENAVVKIGLNETNTSSAGYYRFVNLQPMPGRTITVSHILFETNVTQFDIKPGENNLDFNLVSVEEGIVTGFVFADNKPLPGVTVAIGTSTAITDVNGSYVLTDIKKFMPLDIIAYLSGYKTERKTVTITNDFAYVNFTLEEIPLADIRGTVLEEAGGVDNALVILSNPNFPSRSTKSLPNGNFYIPEVEVYEGGAAYTISATREGYHPTSIQQVLLPGDNEVSIELIPYEPSCGIDIALPPNDFEVSDIRGREALAVTWSNPCKIVAGYYLFKEGELIEYYDVVPPQRLFSYIDEDVEWGETYKYGIIATYDIAGDSPLVERGQTLGDELCEGKFGEFCSQKILRKRCTDENIVEDIEDCSYYGGSYFCSGPDKNMMTYCKNAEPCSPITQDALPFGLYYKTLPTCLGSQYENYCYWDYSHTIVDKCYSCDNPELTSCFDYNSKLACELDNQTCMKGEGSDCGWVYTLPELGKGLCYQAGYEGTDKCSLCKEENLFFNVNCNQDVCSKLGNCYADAEKSSCLSCEGAMCEDYTTEEQCGSPIFIDGCAGITPSSDACSLGVCRWGGSSCFKDGDADGAADCTTYECRQDTEPSESDVIGGHVEINTENNEILFEIKDNEPIIGLYYCIDTSNACCDFEPVVNKKITLQKGSWYIEGKHVYYIRFYSVDGHHNQEQVKWRRVSADLEEPVITISSTVVPKNGAADLEIDIITNEFVACSDSLESYGGGTYSGSQLSNTKIEGHRVVSYANLEYGTYSYKITCVDNGGNEVVKNPLIVVEDPFMVVENPGRVTTETAFKFAVTTAKESSCDLLYLGSKIDDMDTLYGFSHTSTKEHGPFAANRQHTGYGIRCTYNGETREQDILFTVDRLSPTTTAVMTVSGEQRKRTGSGWEEAFYSVEDVSLSFDCVDSPETGFGCSKTVYCFDVNKTGFCLPDTEISEDESISLTETTLVCYYSSDGHNADETTKCGIVAVNRPIAANVVEPSYGVSYEPNFRVLIKATKAASSCKYLGYDWPSGFNYDTLVSDANVFDPVAGDQWHFEKEDFPNILPGWEGFSATNAVGYPRGKPYTFDMFVKCKDLGGAVSQEASRFELRYDPSPPVIKDKYASQTLNGARLREGDVITGFYAILNVVTDDETLCKYDKTETEYELMENGFYQWELDRFKTVHYSAIENPENKKTHTYHVQCKNKAGNFSDAVDISFSVDREKTGIIQSAEADVKKDFSVEFTVITDKTAACSYSNNINGTFYTEYGFTHEAESSAYKNDEGRHELKVSCLFTATGTVVETTIPFSIDKTDPVMKNITLGDYVCDTEEINPTFVAEDDVSGIKEYEYELKEKKIGGDVIAEGVTTQSSPTIDGLDMEVGDDYELSVRATDNSGNTGSWIDVEFTVADENATVCLEKDPPTVTIKETLNDDMTKNVEIICDDDVSCDKVYYGTAATSGNCSPTKSYDDEILVDHTLYLCYEAWDTANNNKTGYKKITISVVKDSDEDGIPDSEDECPNTPDSEVYEIINDSGSPHYGCGPSEIDADGDGMPDYWEIRYNLDPHDPEDRDMDLDGDGATNYEEYLAHTDPTIADISDLDRDGVPDSIDDCAYTPFGAEVDENGCSEAQLDIDGDGIDNDIDKCDRTPYDEIDEIITDPDDEYYGCGPSERPHKKLLQVILLTLGIIFVIAGASYLVYDKFIRGRRMPFRQLLKKKPEVKVVRAVKPVPRPVQRPVARPPVTRAPFRKEVSAEERRKKAVEAIRKKIAERRKRKELFKEFKAKKPKKKRKK